MKTTALALAFSLILSSFPAHAAAPVLRAAPRPVPAVRLTAASVLSASLTPMLLPVPMAALKAPGVARPAVPAIAPFAAPSPSVPGEAQAVHAASVFDGFRVRSGGPSVPSVPLQASSVYKNFTPSTRKVADLRALAEKDKKAALAQALRNFLDPAETRVEVRLAGLRLAAELDKPAALRAARELLAAPVRNPAGLNLGKGVADREWYLRREAARLIGAEAAFVEDKPAVIKLLKEAYEHTNPSVRLAAGWAIRQLGEDPGPEPKVSSVIPETSAPRPAMRESLPPSQARPARSSFWRNMFLIGALVAGFYLFTAGTNTPSAPPRQPTAIVQVDPGSRSGQALAPEEKQAQALESIARDVRRQADALEKLAKPKSSGFLSNILMMGLMTVLSVFLFIWLFKKMSGGAGGGGNVQGMTKAKTNMEKPATRFSDVAGIDETIVEVQEIMDFLQDPQKYTRMGGRIPKGVLLEGPPGTGKTLLARALAGETNAHFFSISASDFVELFVGMGAARVRSLFEQARANAPAIIFIDEIDAVGKARGGAGPQSGGNDEREQTINALLSAMDGFDNSAGIIVMAATNRADVLDPALVRPGRFDRKVYVGLPEVMGREAILQVHARKARLAPEVDLQFVAQRTAGMSGAFLEGVVNDSALLAVRREADAIGRDDVDEAIDRVTIGGKRSLHLSTELKRRIAYHESGHVLANLLGRSPSPVNKVTIIPHGSGALGFAESGSEEGDKYLYTREELEARIDMAMGGLVAEKLLYGSWSTGPGSDLEQATRVARAMVEKLGMSDKVGRGVSAGQPYAQRPVSEETAREIDLEVKRILDESEARVTAILTTHRDKLDAMVAGLMEHETLQRPAIEAIVAK